MSKLKVGDKMQACGWVVVSDQTIVTTTLTREEARLHKAALGGKQAGYSIHKILLGEEVR